MAGKRLMQKLASEPCRYPLGQKFLRNHSISHRFQDKCVFAFYTDIQDGCQKWRDNEYWGNSLAHSADTLQLKTFVEITLSRTVSEIFSVQKNCGV